MVGKMRASKGTDALLPNALGIAIILLFYDECVFNVVDVFFEISDLYFLLSLLVFIIIL